MRIEWSVVLGEYNIFLYVELQIVRFVIGQLNTDVFLYLYYVMLVQMCKVHFIYIRLMQRVEFNNG